MFDAFLQLLYPKLCFACDDPLFVSEEFVCTPCRMSLAKVDLRSGSPWWLRAKFDGLIAYEDIHCMFVFSTGGRVQHLMHHIKYRGAKELGCFLGNWAGLSLKKYHFFSHVDLIIPIPLHPKRLNDRGYNQAACIAEGLSRSLGIILNPTGLIKHNQTESLINQDRMSRFTSLKDSFQAHGDVLNKHVLIVDDTLTSGATLLAAAEKIKAAGAKSISFFALAALK